MKSMMVLSAALILIGAHILLEERRRRSAGREQEEVQLQSWEGEGGRAEDADPQSVSPEPP